MNNTEKAISLFKYIKELYAQRIQVITDVRKQQWYKFKYEIPEDKENITFNFLDNTDEISEEETESAIILQIRKPEFEKCPQLSSMLTKWIDDDWSNFKKNITPKQKLVENKKNKEIVEFFTDDKNRVRTYKEWSNRRDSWVIRQKK